MRNQSPESNLIYNSQVFNLSDATELNLYNQVMRRYGTRLVNSPPERYFSSKSESVHVFIDWLSKYCFEEEFLGEAAPSGPPDMPEDPRTAWDASSDAEQVAEADTALTKLIEKLRLAASSAPGQSAGLSPEDETDA